MTSSKILLFFICILALQADHCLHEPRLLASYSAYENPLPVLYVPAKNGNVKAVQLLLSESISREDPYWLTVSANLMSSDAIFQLVGKGLNEQNLKKLLLVAAQRGHSPSQYELSKFAKTSSGQKRWLTEAAEQGHVKAIEALYEYYASKDQVEKTQRWGELASKHSPQIAVRLATQVWKSGDEAYAKQLLKMAQEQGHVEASTMLSLIKKFSPLSSIKTNDPTSATCTMAIQFVAATLPAMIKIDKIIDRFSKDSRFDDFPVCFNPPVWVNAPTMQCGDDPAVRLSCSLSGLIGIAGQRPFSHAVVVAEHGVANVHNGIMYLDENDDYQVFVHEFAHFAGFIDEYPINESMAEKFCSRNNAPNLVFSKTAPNINATQFAPYINRYPGLALSEARTCQTNEFQAFKPSSELTFLEQHEIGRIPDIYLDIWRKVLTERTSLTPAYVNFAQYFDSSGQHAEAQKWWLRYHQYRQIPEV